MSTGNVMPVPQQQFCDTNGAPYALGTLTFYAAGTTTPQDTYFNSDLAAGHKNDNPLTLDAAGRALVYFKPLGYRVILKDANAVTIYDQDNIFGLDISVLIGTESANTVFAGPTSGAAAVPTFRALTAADVPALSNATCQFRLTLSTGVPVTTADVTAATTVYCAPYVGNKIALYDGSSNWNVRTSTQFSIAVPASTSQMYDVFCYDNSGAPALELTAWTNDTTRATAVTTQDGIYVKTGATTRRYLGSVRTTTSSGQTEDSFAKRFLWNYYNRVRRAMRVFEATDSWTYTTATWRQANGAAANQLALIVGVAEFPVDVTVQAHVANTSAGVAVSVAVKPNATTTPAFPFTSVVGTNYTPVANYIIPITAHLVDYPAVGYNFYAWVEYSAATGTSTWYGDNGGATAGPSSGLIGVSEG